MGMPEPDALRMVGGEAVRRATVDLAAAFAALPQVEAVALGGSRATGRADDASDIDLYVYAAADVPVAFRAALAGRRSDRSEIDNRFWETGDEWDDALAGVHVDVIHREPAWVEDELARVLDRHEARLGYTTCIWHNVLTAQPLFDRVGWFAALQGRARRPYPDALAQAVVAMNRPVLREIFGSYRGQILKAAARGDRVSLNHRTAAFLASYFDALFAANRTPHPGEKRLLAAAVVLRHVPSGLAERIESLLTTAAYASPAADLGAAVDALCDGLDDCLRRSGIGTGD
jgi:predicted nucleotidyltransferase